MTANSVRQRAALSNVVAREGDWPTETGSTTPDEIRRESHKKTSDQRSIPSQRNNPFLSHQAQNIGLADENEFFAVQLDVGRSILLVKNPIARFKDRGIEDLFLLFLFPFGFTTRLLFQCFQPPLPHGTDLTFNRLFLGLSWNEQPSGGLFPRLRRFNQCPIL